MIRLIHGFLITIVFYHLLHTGLVYGLEVTDAFIFSLVKDVLRGCVVLVSVIALRHAKQHYRLRRLLFPALLIAAGCGISYFVRTPTGSDWMSFLVGMKYDVFPLVVLITAGVVGVVYAVFSKQSDAFSSFLFSIVVTVVVGGLVRQLTKIILPDVLYVFGYGSVGDYILGANPPLYYRTGPGGMMRFSGIFAGPNNMGYFLVAFFSRTVRYCMKVLTTKRKRRCFLLLYMIVVFRTFSRGARIGIGVQMLALARRRFPQRKRFVPWVLGAGVLGFVGLSVYKAGSTTGHMIAWQEGIQAIVTNPWGYGPGSSGPSVHYQGVYLPENQYLQILLDLGIVGFIRRLVVFGVIAKELMRRIRLSGGENSFLVMLFLGCLGLAVEGFFLHTLEDSMVNYLVFVAVMVYGNTIRN